MGKSSLRGFLFILTIILIGYCISNISAHYYHNQYRIHYGHHGHGHHRHNRHYHNPYYHQHGNEYAQQTTNQPIQKSSRIVRGNYGNANGNDIIIKIHRKQPQRIKTTIEDGYERRVYTKTIYPHQPNNNGQGYDQSNGNYHYPNNNQDRYNSEQVNYDQNNNFISNDNSIIDAKGISCRTLNGGYPGICKQKGLCYYFYGSVKFMESEICPTTHNGQQIEGICCPLDIHFTPNYMEIPYRLTEPRWPQESVTINRYQFQQAMKQANLDVQNFIELEKYFIGQMRQVQVVYSPEHFLQVMFGPADQNQQLLNLWGFYGLQLSRVLARILQLSPEAIRDGLTGISLRGSAYEQYCLPSIRCNNKYQYRTIDGSCNNQRNPFWGRSLVQFQRLMLPEYSDGLSEFRKSVSGGALPSARIISTKVMQTSSFANAQFSKNWNVMFMQWGQFLDHDITLGTSTRAFTGEGLFCCNRTNAQGPLIHSACRPIYLPPNDPHYAQFNRRCHNFVRSAVGPKVDCSLGYRDQMNSVTSFIDGSMVYGSNSNRSRIVRRFENGLLNTAQINGNEWLPFDTMNNSIACSVTMRGRNQGCVFAGDVRVNQQFGIVALQLMFLREHNRLARKLQQLNPNWNDETLYQEARKIVIAQLQHITYNEFLPEALGRNVIKRYGLSLQPTGYSNDYDSNVNPSILNEFAAAAFRWHTLVQKFYHMIDENGHNMQTYQMHQIFNNPTYVYGRGHLDQAIRGILKHPSERFDSLFTEDVKNLLFAPANSSVGLDMVSINIQRGRDHGIPGYNRIRKLCGLTPVNSFEQLQYMLASPNDWQKLARVYQHVDDIDFWVGGTLEQPLDEGILGPTFSCIVGEQFRRLKNGDRFWYENGQMLHSFSKEQLAEIRKVTLAGIICLNSDSVRRVQPLAMLTLSQQNDELDCSLIPQMDLSAWQTSSSSSHYSSGSNNAASSNRYGRHRSPNSNLVRIPPSQENYWNY